MADKEKIVFAVMVEDFARVVKGALFRRKALDNGDSEGEMFDFSRGVWITSDPVRTVPAECEIDMDVPALRRVAETLYRNCVLDIVPPGYVSIQEHEQLRTKLEQAKQAHLEDLRLLLKTKDNG